MLIVKTTQDISMIFSRLKIYVKKIVLRKKFFIFVFGLCSRLKKVIYGFFNSFLGEFNVRVLKYCIQG